MKKILVVFLILAAAGGIFAQEQGLKWGGSLRTGLKFAAGQEVNDGSVNPGNKGKVKNLDPSLALYHDDSGAIRLDLEGSYTKDNYGAVFRLRFRPYQSLYLTDLGNQVWTPGVDTNELVHQAYVWADFFNNMINVKAGKIDDSVWATKGDEEFHYSTGLGLRFEVKPLDGLNAGVFFNTTNQAYFADLWDLASGDGYAQAAEVFLLETAFGAQLELPILDIAGGLRLDSHGDGLDTEEWYDWGTWDWDSPNTYSESSRLGGLGAYLGANLKVVENLTAAAEVRFNNLSGFNKYGWVWVNEVFEFNVTESLGVGLVMHQYFFGKDHLFAPRKDNESVAPLLKFTPKVSFGLTDRWSVGCELPLAFWPNAVAWDLGIKPKVSYKLGDNASISGYYKLQVYQYDKATGYGKGGDAPDPLVNNTVQINFEWSF
ncbi:MAG: hypothetical protein LBD55_10735 [Treponema sp.]|jgi:hypothetical protein|nr:hypothetical protein [Treponema sp.]